MLGGCLSQVIDCHEAKDLRQAIARADKSEQRVSDHHGNYRNGTSKLVPFALELE